MEHRVSALEKNVGRMEDKLDRLLDDLKAFRDDLKEVRDDLKEFRTETMVRFAKIEEKLEFKASAVELAEVKGRVASLPTTFQMITLVFGILGGAFLILRFGLPHGP